MREQRVKEKKNAAEELCDVVMVSAVIAGAALGRAAIGAVDGAIGYMVASQTKAVPAGFTLSSTVASQAAGAAIISPITGLVFFGTAIGLHDCLSKNIDNKYDPFNISHLTMQAVFLTALNTIGGLLDGFTGAGVFQMIPPGPAYQGNTSPQSDFTAMVGAAGGSLSMLGVFIPLMVCRVTYLSYMACCYDPDPKPKAPQLSMPNKMLNAFKSQTQGSFATDASRTSSTFTDNDISGTGKTVKPKGNTLGMV
jgi:hypothetical protein